jgi:hypothetical protein
MPSESTDLDTFYQHGTFMNLWDGNGTKATN